MHAVDCKNGAEKSCTTDPLLSKLRLIAEEMDTLLQEPNMTEHGDDILSVALEEGLFLFVHDILKNDTMPILRKWSTFTRVEFQQRGSPHIHALKSEE